jgi:hypothetical protein
VYLVSDGFEHWFNRQRRYAPVVSINAQMHNHAQAKSTALWTDDAGRMAYSIRTAVTKREYTDGGI